LWNASVPKAVAGEPLASGEAGTAGGGDMSNKKLMAVHSMTARTKIAMPAQPASIAEL
jgi:hypothetical protein